ncbi:MAG: histidinol-phosphate transaminase [Nitrospiraceae bacterium]|nr:histidinol-phosphate transaminase [Nitrospiraceae bacterium]
MNLKRLVKKEVSRLRAYDAKEIPCRIKLDANESPYGFGPALKAAKTVLTNRYPDPDAARLKGLLSRSFGVKEANILQGNGSDELIYYLITTFGGPVLYPVPTFSMYGIIGRALGEETVEIPLDGEFDLDEDRMLRAVRKTKPKLIFLSSPNNPTGNCFSAGKILKIIEQSRGIVVVDEAYQPFASEEGFLPLLKDYENLVIMRTLSKIGLAALRLGFMVAEAGIVAEVNKVRLPFNVNSFSQAVAAAALKDRRGLQTSLRAIVSGRDLLFEGMEKIEGVRPHPSEANFVLFAVKDADKVYRSLLKKGILVRNLDGVVKGCLRVTVGTPRENAAFLKALAVIMSKERQIKEVA